MRMVIPSVRVYDKDSILTPNYSIPHFPFQIKTIHFF
jgi:hypothetical protein